VRRCHAAILDQIVEMDENLMEKYLGGEEPDYGALHPAFEKAMDEAHVVPIPVYGCEGGGGRAGAAGRDREALPQPGRREPREFLTGSGDGIGRNEHRSRTPTTTPSRYWRTCSR